MFVLTVMAVLISVSVGFYAVYHKIHSGVEDYNENEILDKDELSGETLAQFRGFFEKFNDVWSRWNCSRRSLHYCW